jgi:DNA polymerase III subunit delta
MPPKTPPTIYILHGDDDQAIDEFLQQLRAKLGDPVTAEMNTTRVDAKGLSLADLRAACCTAPFLAKRRLVILEGFLSAFSSRRGKSQAGASDEPDEEAESSSAGKEILTEFLAFLPEVPSSTALVLAEKRKLPESNPVLKWAAGAGDMAYVREFLPTRGSALPNWILQRAQAQGGQFTLPAAQLLASVAGDDPRTLFQEIFKLLTYANFARAVTPQDVIDLTPESALTGIFEMVDSIGSRDGSRALRLLRKTVEQGNVPAVFGMVVRQFRLLLLAREALDAGTPAANLAQALEVHPFVARKLASQARNFTLPALENIYRRLRDIDDEVKSGRVELDTAMESLVAELAS